MNPVIKEWYVQGLNFLENVNEMKSFFHLRLELEIEYENLKGIDDYSIDICDIGGLTKEINKYFESEFEKNNSTNSRYVYKTLLLKEYNKVEIVRQITEFVNSCSGTTWEEVNLKLQEKLEYNP